MREIVTYTAAEFLDRWPQAPGDITQVLAPKADAVVVAVLEDERLVGYWPIWHTLHVDGIWLDPQLKADGPGTLRSLLQAVFATLRAAGVAETFAVLPEHGPSREQAARLGFTRAPGDLYLLRVP